MPNIGDLISDKNSRHTSRIDLTELTGKDYARYDQLKSTFPFEMPSPDSVQFWVNTAIDHNGNLRAAEETASASLNTAIASGANQFLPSVNAQATYGRVNYDSNAPVIVTAAHTIETWTAQLNFTWNLFAGGANFATTLQNAHTYAANQATADDTYRQTVKQVKQDYRDAFGSQIVFGGQTFVEIMGEKVWWKIDLYDRAYEYGSSNPTSLADTRRVLTILFPSDY
mgnify:FL=1